MQDGSTWCGGCDRTLPRTAFYIRRMSRDGLQTQCKACNARSARKSFRRRHGIPLDADLHWRANPLTPERERAYFAAWRKANREKLREYHRDWKRRELERHPEVVRQRRNAWRVANPDKSREYDRRKYGRRRSAVSLPFTCDELDRRLSMFGGLCWLCHASGPQVDHVKPLARGGADMLANLRPICGRCNSSKGAKWPFPTHRRWFMADVKVELSHPWNGHEVNDEVEVDEFEAKRLIRDGLGRPATVRDARETDTPAAEAASQQKKK